MEPDGYGYARRLVCVYFRMLTVGCGAAGTCSNRHCRSHPESVELTPSEAAAKSILLATIAPVPICSTAFTSASAGTSARLNDVEEERPEVDEDDDEDEREEDEEELRRAAEQACSPRRRLSHAVEMDMALNAGESLDARDDEPTVDDGVSERRHTSLHKQKLLNALKQSFPGMPPELQVAKKH